MLTLGLLVLSFAVDCSSNPENRIWQKHRRISKTGLLIEVSYLGQCEPDGTFTGRYIIKKTDPQLEGEDVVVEHYRRGRRHGVQKRTSPFGETQVEHYADGEMNGRRLEFDSRGKLRKIGTYKNGVEHGVSAVWRTDGSLWFSREMKDGRRHGTWAEWWPNRRLKQRVTYTDGKRNGAAWSWYENGRVQSKTFYNAGVPVGRAVSWTENGNWIPQAVTPNDKMADDGQDDGRFFDDIAALHGVYAKSAPLVYCRDIPGVEGE